MKASTPSGVDWFSIPDQQLDELVGFAAKDIPLPANLRDIVQRIHSKRKKSPSTTSKKSKLRPAD